jgi:Glu-tRNA(Gln) amidotransferase subunit E-like FAD-binding protein
MKYSFKVGFEMHKQLVRPIIKRVQCGYAIVNKPLKLMVADVYYENTSTRRVEIKTQDRLNTSTNYYSYAANELYEIDEYPPVFNEEVLHIAKAAVGLLGLSLCRRSAVMRKHIYDGSIACGFQRTILCSNPEQEPVSFETLSISSVYIEEDSCSKDYESGTFIAKRSGVALLEVVTTPLEISFEDLHIVQNDLKKLNDFLNTGLFIVSPRAAVRQDINIGYLDTITEIKGVEDIGSAIFVIKNEVNRLERMYEQFRVNAPRIVAETVVISKLARLLCSDFDSMNLELLNESEEHKTYRISSPMIGLITRYTHGNFSCTRGLRPSLLTDFTRPKGSRTRLHVETDLSPVEWNSFKSIEYANSPETIRSIMCLTEFSKIPYDTDTWRIIRKYAELNMRSLLVYLNSNFSKFLESEHPLKYLQLFCELFTKKMVDFNFLSVNSVFKLKEITSSSVMDLVKDAVENQYNLRESLRLYSAKIPHRLLFIQEFKKYLMTKVQ